MAAVVAAAGAVWCWFGAQTTVTVAPILAGEPQTTSVAYSPPMLVLMLLLATVAGVLAVSATAYSPRRSDREIAFPVADRLIHSLASPGPDT